MKSILWILNGCGLEGQGITGGPVRFYEISRRFAALGYKQHLMTTLGGEEMLKGLGCTLPMTVVRASLVLSKEPCRLFRMWSYIVSSFFWRLKRGSLPDTDIVITASDYFCDVIPAMSIKRKKGCKWISWIYHCESDPAKRPGNRLVNEVTSRMQSWSFKRIARFADRAWISDTVAGDEIERRLTVSGMALAKIRRKKNGVNADRIKAAKEPERKLFDAVMIGVRPNKGLADIIPIWEEVVKKRPGSTLRLMGGMSGHEKILAEIRKRNLPIEVLQVAGGKILPADEYYARIKEARILFAPSHEEGWGIVLAESMAAGLPVVAYDLPAYRKIYAQSYFKVPCFDIAKFAETVVKALDDDEAYRQMQAKGRLTAEKYDWDRIADEDAAAL